MRFTTTTLTAAAVLAMAAVSSSATATPLDAELVNTAAPDVATETTTSNSSATTSGSEERKAESGCGKMWSRNWSDFKYACEWDHSTAFDRRYNRFFKSYSGEVVMECECDTGLEVYRPWGPQWKYTMAEWGKIRCYSRDENQAMGLKDEFDAYTCFPKK